MMATGTRRKSLIQIAVALPMMVSGSFWILTLASISREEAVGRGRSGIPADWDRVVINHGSVYHWPFPPSMFWPFFLLFLGCMTFLVLFTQGIGSKREE